MREYEVTLKSPAIYAREGAGTYQTYKLRAGNQGLAAHRAFKRFKQEYKKRDAVGYTLFLTIVRVS